MCVCECVHQLPRSATQTDSSFKREHKTPSAPSMSKHRCHIREETDIQHIRLCILLSFCPLTFEGEKPTTKENVIMLN